MQMAGKGDFLSACHRKKETIMRTALLSAASVACLALAPFAVLADEVPAGAVLVKPGEIKWKPSTRVAGLENADIVGDSNKPGDYVFRVRFPANFQVKAHTHPENRSYTIISGTWYIGWGETNDPQRMIALPPESFYTEPANVPHFVATRDEPVVVQISGTGPTATKLIGAEKR
jgi:uncharacterized RmlC-like cupin family protein